MGASGAAGIAYHLYGYKESKGPCNSYWKMLVLLLKNCKETIGNLEEEEEHKKIRKGTKQTDNQ